jgi:NADH:ubiquinone oxidoreductase subunit 3 (subunit A)
MRINIITFIGSPPIMFIIFMLTGWLLLAGGKKIAAKGEDSPGKHMHYSCGEDLDVPSFSLNYHQFFRLALLFGILHMVALLIATIPYDSDTQFLPVIYLVSAGIGMFILLEHDESKHSDR